MKELTETFVDVTNTVKFVSAFFAELARNWDGIDIFRINKYDRLVRRVLEGLYNSLAANSWNPEHIAQANAMLIAGPYSTNLRPPFPVSLTMHVNDVIIDSIDRAAEKAPAELENTTAMSNESLFYFEKSNIDGKKSMEVENDDDVNDDAMEEEGGEDGEKEEVKEIRVVPRDVLTKLMEPFIYCVAYGNNKPLYKELVKKIFEPLSCDSDWPHIMRDTEAIRKAIMAFASKAEAEAAAGMESDDKNDEKEKEIKKTDEIEKENEVENEEVDEEIDEEKEEEVKVEKMKRRRRWGEDVKKVFSERLMSVAMIMHKAKKTGGVTPTEADVPSVNELVDILKEKYSQDRKSRPRTKRTKKGKRKANHRRNLNLRRKKYYNSINK